MRGGVREVRARNLHVGDGMIRFCDVDWREVLNYWDEEDIEYLLCICQEKLDRIRKARLRTTNW